MNHTPTPWHTASDESGYFRCIEKDDRLIARLPSSDSLKAEADAASNRRRMKVCKLHSLALARASSVL